jgi:hypothetical protein
LELDHVLGSKIDEQVTRMRAADMIVIDHGLDSKWASTLTNIIISPFPLEFSSSTFAVIENHFPNFLSECFGPWIFFNPFQP